MAAGLSDSEPSPRWGHISAPVDGKLYVWGGHTKKFSSQAKRKLASTLHVFNPIMESWKDQSTTGVPSPGLFGGACASAGDCLYVDMVGLMDHITTVPSTSWTLRRRCGPC